MKKLSTLLVGASMLALSACGGGADEANTAYNSTDNLAVPADDLNLPADNEVVDAGGNVVATDLDASANVGADLNAAAPDPTLNGL